MHSYRVRVTDEQIAYGIDVGDRIHNNKKETGFKDKGGHARKNPDKSNHMGYIGETVYADIIGEERPEVIDGDLDDGFDFEKDGNEIQVKTTETDYLILFPENFGENDPDTYVCIQMEFDELVDGEDREVIVHEIEYEEFVDNIETVNFGYGPRLVMELPDETSEDTLRDI